MSSSHVSRRVSQYQNRNQIRLAVCFTCVLSIQLFDIQDTYGDEPNRDAKLVKGVIVDSEDRPVAARLYIQSTADGKWYWARSAVKTGSAVEYRKQRSPTVVENHTTLSAHPFEVDLPPGWYNFTAERGKEYFAASTTIEIGKKTAQVKLKLRRWINLAERGWYSGDTHVHRSIQDLPNVILAEDLNVALPLTNWVTKSYTPPSQGNKNSESPTQPKLITVDPTHVIYPLNTEYEIFTVNGRRHTLGAVFVLNHKSPLKLGAPPVRPIADEARRQGAILDLDKHSWAWSMMLVPIMNVDLYELSNNHIWRTEFLFKRWTIDTIPDYFKVETDKDGLTERGWLNYGLGLYYTLLNCGFQMRPTAGTASGVHPVPLGFGRVYVHLPDGFNYRAWMQGLDAGRTFVTTGPMLFVKFNDQAPGHKFKNVQMCRIAGSAFSEVPLDRIEVIVNGEIVHVIKPLNKKRDSGGFNSAIQINLKIEGSSWVALRCFEKRGERFRFSHSSPVHFQIDGKPLRPRRAEVQYLIRRMEEEIARNTNVLKPAEIGEFRRALEIYQRIAKTAR